MVPAIGLYAVLLAYPLARVLINSFHDDATGAWVLSNYQNILTNPVFRNVMVTTTRTAGITTAICLALGYPTAYVIATAPRRLSQTLEFVVILPLMTSVLVRAFAWIALLQVNGPVEATLQGAHISSRPVGLLYNSTGVIIGMVHVMLPFAILPMVSVMRHIDKRLVQAASILGATPLHAFRTVFLPLSLPGVGAAAIICFLLSLGFYTTPAILGGGRNVMLAQLIDIEVNRLLAINQASALAITLILLAVVVVLLALAGRVVMSRLSLRTTVAS
jgi:putative spermidine/putrescine transport system permease protein